MPPRVMRTAKRMDLATVAVYSDADANAQHVRAADRAVHIGGSLPRQSYLNINALIAAARSSGAQAVHPGYGFLAACLRNPRFAQGSATTGFVAQEGAALLSAVSAESANHSSATTAALIATALYAWRAAGYSPLYSPLAPRYALPLRIGIDEVIHTVGLKPLVDQGFKATSAEEAHEYWLSDRSPNAISLRTSSGAETIYFAFSASRDSLVGEAQWRGRRYAVRDLTLAAAQSAAAGATDGTVKAPLAGRVVAIHVQPGDALLKGAPLLVIEAMKMEHTQWPRALPTRQP